MISIRLFQRTDKLRDDGTAPIYYVLAKGRKRKYITSKRYLPPRYFDNSKGIVLRGSDSSIKLNAFFKRQMTRLDDIIINFINEGIDPTFEMIERKYLNENDSDFLTFAFAELEREKTLISHKTYIGYKDRLNHLKKYIDPIPFNSINHEFLTTYRYHLVNNQRKTNGYYQDFATIKKFYRMAVIKGLATGNPFANFKLEKEDTLREWLNKDELKLLHALLNDNYTNKKDEPVRISEAVKNTLRHFLFCCYTGLRLGDKKIFGPEHIEDNRIKLRTSKRGKHIYVPLNKSAQELLSPVLARQIKQGTNRIAYDLRQCFAAVDIKKHLTFHSSRHTFAVNCILAGVDLITVRDWLGHRSVTTTEIYAKIAAQYKDESMKKLDGFLS